MKILQSLLICALSFGSVSAQSFLYQVDSLRGVYHIPALAIAVIGADSIPLTYVCGYRNSITKEPAMMTDLFHLGSNTKAITSFVAAKLVEQGRIKWETKFFDIFPKAQVGSRSDYKNITFEQLLSHRAGIRPFTDGNEFAKLPPFTGTATEQRKLFALWLLKQRPVKPKLGEQYVYSNAGYAVAAVMLEQITKKSWEDLVREHIQDSLHIAVAFGWPNRQNIHQPWGHVVQNDSLVPTPPDDLYKVNPLIEPAGDISMDIGGYAKFVQLHLQGLRDKPGYLTPESFQRLHYGMPDYALGWGWVFEKGNHISFHDGSAGTFFCHAIISEEDNIALIVICNTYSEQTQKGVYAIRKLLKKVYGK